MPVGRSRCGGRREPADRRLRRIEAARATAPRPGLIVALSAHFRHPCVWISTLSSRSGARGRRPRGKHIGKHNGRRIDGGLDSPRARDTPAERRGPERSRTSGASPSIGCRSACRTAATQQMEAARALVDEVARRRAHLRRQHRLRPLRLRDDPADQVEELQLRLLRSHACGVGEPYPDEVVRAAMLLRANALAKGYSGARPTTVELLIDCLNRGVLPARARARLGRRERRPGSAGASRAAARRRGRSVVRRAAAARVRRRSRRRAWTPIATRSPRKGCR